MSTNLETVVVGDPPMGAEMISLIEPPGWTENCNVSVKILFDIRDFVECDSENYFDCLQYCHAKNKRNIQNYLQE